MTANKFLATLLATFVTLCYLWCQAGTASASELTPGLHAYESDCHAQPLHNGRVGETVRVCEHVKLVRVEAPHAARPLRGKLDKDGTCSGLPAACCDWRTGSKALCQVHTRKPGVTTVLHYGVRAPVYTIAYIL